jgi:hypothetical protein
VDSNGIASIIRGLVDRRGITALLRHLGFERPLQRARRPAGAPSAVCQLQCSSRHTLVAWVAESKTDLDPLLLRQLLRSLRDSDAVRHQLALVVEAHSHRIAVVCDMLGTGPRHVLLDPHNIRACDIDALFDLRAQPGESDTAAAVRIARGLDRSRVTDRFFRDVVAVRNLVARSWAGIPDGAEERRDGLALLLLSRLMFLYFLQRQGLLNGEQRFLPRLLSKWRSRRRSTSFYRGMLGVLFFGVLNRRPARRTPRAAALGELPYLNGGLFEVHRLELESAELDLSDEVLSRVFSDVLDKYRFTTADAVDHQLNGDVLTVDPEMLGRIFEGLMPGDRRGRTGTFYTPANLVDRVVVMALTEHMAERCELPTSVVGALLQGEHREIAAGPAAALRDCAGALRVLDPACGSGAFLLGALSRLATLAGAAQHPEDSLDIRRDIVANGLHGVDLLEDAALICSLRLWLALVPQCSDSSAVPPLPNLDRRIRQGDALVDPFDLGADVAGRPLDTGAPPELRRLLQSLEQVGSRYLSADPDTRPALRRELHQLETGVAKCWFGALEWRLHHQARELTARAGDCDLFGARAPHAVAAERQLKAVERKRAELQSFGAEMNMSEGLPFFSFRVHFAGASPGFDMILSNPPWVRSHNWPPPLRRLLRERYQVCATAGWPYAATLAGTPHAAGAQVDLSLLFLEKSIRLLAQDGTLGMLLPSKLLRSLYASGAREMLLHQMQLLVLEDHSLDHRALFDADAFTAVVLARKSTAQPSTDDSEPAVRVTLAHTAGPSLHFELPVSELPLRKGDARSPWLLVPPECRAIIRQMQQSGVPIGEALTVRRGAMTGANEVLVVRDVEPRLGDNARIRTEGYYRAATTNGRRAYSGWIEASCLRPALRGADVGAWTASVERHLIWTPYNHDRTATAPPRLKQFLQRHRSKLGPDVHSRGMLHRLSRQALGDKVVWSDLATDLRAAAVPAQIRNVTGTRSPVIPLNTVYFIATESPDESMLLSAYLNSLPLRVFARAIAERAKDLHFRFFAWTIAVLPLPRDWRTNRHAAPLKAMAQKAHVRCALSVTETHRLDELVAQSYGLTIEQLSSLRAFDDWLRGGRVRDVVAL